MRQPKGRCQLSPLSVNEESLPIAFQGRPGAYSDLACRTARPGLATLPCDTFEQAIAAVHDGRAALAMLPCENSLAGRVPDIHALLPGSGLSIVGEHFLRVEHCLMAPRGATLAGLRRVHSHAVALGQVRRIVGELGLLPIVQADTAGSAQLVAEWGRPEDAAVASALAAEIHGLEVLRFNVEDAAHNTTRFYVTALHPVALRPGHAGIDDDVRFPGAQRAGSSFQGAGRVRHQRRQHDEVGKLHGWRRIYGDAVFVRRGGPSRAPQPSACPGGARVFFP